MGDEERFGGYYGLGEVNMELRDLWGWDYYYDLGYKYYDKMDGFEKDI